MPEIKSNLDLDPIYILDMFWEEVKWNIGFTLVGPSKMQNKNTEYRIIGLEGTLKIF